MCIFDATNGKYRLIDETNIAILCGNRIFQANQGKMRKVLLFTLNTENYGK
jgi:hypothetical protein